MPSSIGVSRPPSPTGGSYSAAVIAGTLSTAGLFGTVDQLVSFASTPVLGEIAMLALALKMTARDWRAGQLRFLLIALTVAVAAA